MLKLYSNCGVTVSTSLKTDCSFCVAPFCVDNQMGLCSGVAAAN